MSMKKKFYLLLLVKLFTAASVLYGLEVNNIVFELKKGRGGCSKCDMAVDRLFSDNAKMDFLSKKFKEGTKVYFYTRSWAPETVIPKDVYSIAVGRCTYAIKKKCTLYISGCRSTISANLIYNTLLMNTGKEFSRTETKNKILKKPAARVAEQAVKKEKITEVKEKTVQCSLAEHQETPLNELPEVESSVQCASCSGAGEIENVKVKPMVILNFSVFITLMLIWTALVFHIKASAKYLLIISLITFLYFGMFLHGCPCPVGNIGNVLLSLKNRVLTSEIYPYIIFIIPIVTAFIFGRIFCSSVCIFGALQEIVSWKEIKVPNKLEKILRAGKYLVLFFVLYYIFFQNNPYIVCDLNPFFPVFHLWGTPAAWGAAAAAVILSLLFRRFFCRWLCPYAVILGLFSRFSLVKREIIKDKCINCRQCEKACPTRCISLPDIDNSNCLMCDRCRVVCKKDAVK